MPENGTHKCTNAVNIVQPIRNSSHMAKILSVYNILQARDYENGNGGKRRVSRLTKFIHATICDLYSVDYDVKFNMNLFSLGLCLVCPFVLFDLFVFPYPFVFPWAVESSPLQFLASA